MPGERHRTQLGGQRRKRGGHGAGTAFDATLMDIQMPVMDGTAATRAIRALQAASGQRRSCIVVVTADVLTHQVME
jgi:CheY-like chemotaxis protein